MRVRQGALQGIEIDSNAHIAFDDQTVGTKSLTRIALGLAAKTQGKAHVILGNLKKSSAVAAVTAHCLKLGSQEVREIKT